MHVRQLLCLKRKKVSASNWLFLVFSSIILTFSYCESLGSTKPLFICKKSNHNSNDNYMFKSNKSQKREIIHESSTLRELKEIIKQQASEIQSLKEIAKAETAAPSSSSHLSHHGPPDGDGLDISTYLTSPFYKLAVKRVGWLSIFLCSLSLTAVIMQGFEHTLSRQIELAYFVPLLAGHGGNTGGQTVGTVLSSLSNGSITTKDALRVIRKEAMCGLTCGIILGSIVGPLAHFMGGISLHVATVVFCTLPLLSTIAATLASTIPFACTVIGLDPAIIAAPAMTSFVDVSGLLSYFLIANRVFKCFGLDL